MALIKYNIGSTHIPYYEILYKAHSISECTTSDLLFTYLLVYWYNKQAEFFSSFVSCREVWLHFWKLDGTAQTGGTMSPCSQNHLIWQNLQICYFWTVSGGGGVAVCKPNFQHWVLNLLFLNFRGGGGTNGNPTWVTPYLKSHDNFH